MVVLNIIFHLFCSIIIFFSSYKQVILAFYTVICYYIKRWLAPSLFLCYLLLHL
nr:MAG TPA_asm: hypothetical protein [Caudoviricetes sp.]